MDFLLGWFGLSLVVGLYASTKGRSALGFTLLSLFISPLFGFIFALIVSPIEDVSVVPIKDLKECRYCKELIRKDALFCRYCGKDQNEQTPPSSNDDTNLNKTVIPRKIYKEYKYDTHFIKIENYQLDDFKDLKETLFEQYNPLGYDSVVTNSATLWKIKNSTNDRTYIELSLKPQYITIEAYNVSYEPVVFKEDCNSDLAYVDRIIELGKMFEKGLLTKEEYITLKGKIE